MEVKKIACARNGSGAICGGIEFEDGAEDLCAVGRDGDVHGGQDEQE